MPRDLAQPTEPVDPAARTAIADALYRFAAGLDLDDRALFEGSLTLMATLDMCAIGRKLEAPLPVLRGRDTICNALLPTLTTLDTSHTVTNLRIIACDGDTAEVSALIEAQHVARTAPRDHFLMKNFCTASVRRGDDGWRIDGLVLENSWMTGLPGVVFHPLLDSIEGVRALS